MQDFRKLTVWQRAHALSIRVHRSAKRFPRSGYAELRSQLTRAAQSVGANIVEGCSASTPKEFARFLDISIKSTSELEYHLMSARDYGVTHADQCRLLSTEAVEIRRMLYGLRKRVLAAAEGPESRPTPNSQTCDNAESTGLKTTDH